MKQRRINLATATILFEKGYKEPTNLVFQDKQLSVQNSKLSVNTLPAPTLQQLHEYLIETQDMIVEVEIYTRFPDRIVAFKYRIVMEKDNEIFTLSMGHNYSGYYYAMTAGLEDAARRMIV